MCVSFLFRSFHINLVASGEQIGFNKYKRIETVNPSALIVMLHITFEHQTDRDRGNGTACVCCVWYAYVILVNVKRAIQHVENSEFAISSVPNERMCVSVSVCVCDEDEKSGS